MEILLKGLITYFLWSHEIEKEDLDMSVVRHTNLMGKLVDVTRTKVLDTSHGPVLSDPDRQARDDVVMAHMFEKPEQLQI